MFDNPNPDNDADLDLPRGPEDSGGICGYCGEHFAPDELRVYDAMYFCDDCYYDQLEEDAEDGELGLDGDEE